MSRFSGMRWDSIPKGALDNVRWGDLQKDDPKLYAQIKPLLGIKDGRLTLLPDNLVGPVLAWVDKKCAEQEAAAAASTAKAEAAAKHRAAVEAIRARRHAEFLAQHGTAIELGNRHMGLQRIQQYATERGLAEDPSNAIAITEWCLANGGMSEQNVDRAVAALSSTLTWSTFAARLRS